MSEIDLYGVKCPKDHPAYPLWSRGEKDPQKWAEAAKRYGQIHP